MVEQLSYDSACRLEYRQGHVMIFHTTRVLYALLTSAGVSLFREKTMAVPTSGRREEIAVVLFNAVNENCLQSTVGDE